MKPGKRPFKGNGANSRTNAKFVKDEEMKIKPHLMRLLFLVIGRINHEKIIYIGIRNRRPSG